MHVARLMAAILIGCCLTAPGLAQPTERVSEPISLDKLLSVSNIAEVVSDVRRSSEAFSQTMVVIERLSVPLLEATAAITQNVATTSSRFDPFGMKEAIQTIQRQQDVIEQQHQQIVQLQQREIRRIKRNAAKSELTLQTGKKRPRKLARVES